MPWPSPVPTPNKALPLLWLVCSFIVSNPFGGHMCHLHIVYGHLLRLISLRIWWNVSVSCIWLQWKVRLFYLCIMLMMIETCIWRLLVVICIYKDCTESSYSRLQFVQCISLCQVSSHMLDYTLFWFKLNKDDSHLSILLLTTGRRTWERNSGVERENRILPCKNAGTCECYLCLIPLCLVETLSCLSCVLFSLFGSFFFR
jgi:hypothetical protein